ncbi:MAG: substrate-binding domain-containing protein [Pseudomonadota bacterium]
MQSSPWKLGLKASIAAGAILSVTSLMTAEEATAAAPECAPAASEMMDTSEYKKDAPYRIGFANAAKGDGWLVTFFHTVENAAEKHADKLDQFIITDANGDPTKQISDIQDLLNQDIDLLLVNPATADALDPIVGRVMRRGIPVVSAARRVKTDDNFVSFATASDTSLACHSATWLAEHLDGKGKIVLLPGKAGASPAETRLNTAREIFAQYPDIEIIDVQYTGWSPANGKAIMSAILQRHGKDIQGVWADSGLQGSGSVEAFLNAGFASDEIPPHTGGDLNRMYLLALEHGFPFIGVDYTPAIGGSAVDLAIDILEGKPVPKQYVVPAPIVVSEGHDTKTIKGTVALKDYANPNQPGDYIMGHGIGSDYDPKNFEATYPR